MKNIHKATRPAWAVDLLTLGVLVVTLLVVTVGSTQVQEQFDAYVMRKASMFSEDQISPSGFSNIVARWTHPSDSDLISKKLAEELTEVQQSQLKASPNTTQSCNIVVTCLNNILLERDESDPFWYPPQFTNLPARTEQPNFMLRRKLLESAYAPAINDGNVWQSIYDFKGVVFDGLITIFLTVACWGAVRIYRLRQIGCYPRTFIYCFKMPADSTTGCEAKDVLGYLYVRAVRNGQMEAAGASFDWKDGAVNLTSRVGFRSIHVGSTEEAEDESTCHILFELDAGDALKRRYTKGLLQFKLRKDFRAVIGGPDVYEGFLQSTDKENLYVHALGYAEYLSRGIVNAANESEQVIPKLSKHGAELVTKRAALWQDVISAERSGENTQTVSLRAPIKRLENDVSVSGETNSGSLVNSWGLQIPCPQSAILNPRLRVHIGDLLSKTMAVIGSGPKDLDGIMRLAVEKAKTEKNVAAYENALKQALSNYRRSGKLNRAVNHRAEIVYQQIKPHFIGETMLDIGCGNGLISNLARNDFKTIQMVDVVNYVHEGIELPFLLYQEGQPLPVQNSFDTVLVLTVLHHASDPVSLLKHSWAFTNKRLIIIESVVGVQHVISGINYELVDKALEDQIAYAAFVDWFYNRVLHDGIPVPYNFTTPEQWKRVFAANSMPLAQEIYLGQDIEIGPEFHVLFVLEKS